MILKKLPDINNKVAWIGIIIFLKLLWFCFFIKFFTLPQDTFPGFWGDFSGDSLGYIGLAEKFFRSNDFRYIFSFRMFGYALPYLIVRTLFNQSATLNVLIVFQNILSAFSVYFLSLISVRIFKKNIFFFFTLAGYFSIVIVSFYDIFVLTESFTASSIIISLYYLFKGKSNKDFVLSGLFLTWAIFLRPVCFPLAFLFLIFIFITCLNGSLSYFRKSITRIVKVSFFFLLPLVIVEGVWIYGNLKYNNVFTLTTPTVFAPVYLDQTKHTIPLIDFSKAIGDYWENSWFYSDTDSYPFDSGIETSKFNKESLIELKKDIQTTQTDLITFNSKTPEDQIIKLNSSINDRLKIYTESVKEEKPFRYYVVVPLTFLVRVANSSSTERMFGSYQTTSKKLVLIRLVFDIVVWGIEIFFLLSLPFIFLRINENFNLALIATIVLYFYIIHTIIFKSKDFRYVVSVLPLIIPVIEILLQRIPFFKIKDGQKE